MKDKREMKELIFTLALRGICQKKASIFNTLTYLSNSDLDGVQFVMLVILITDNCWTCVLSETTTSVMSCNESFVVRTAD